MESISMEEFGAVAVTSGPSGEPTLRSLVSDALDAAHAAVAAGSAAVVFETVWQGNGNDVAGLVSAINAGTFPTERNRKAGFIYKATKVREARDGGHYAPQYAAISEEVKEEAKAARDVCGWGVEYKEWMEENDIPFTVIPQYSIRVLCANTNTPETAEVLEEASAE